MKILVKLFIVLSLLSSADALAFHKDLPSGLTGSNLDSTYQEASARLKEIKKQAGTRLLKTFYRDKGARQRRFTKKQAQLKKDYFEALKIYEDLKPIYELKDALNQLYFDNYKNQSIDKEALNKESAVMAVNLIGEIYRLRERYRSIFIPILHNMMIDVGVRKRGACKHWAEDLLTFLRKIPRTHFYGVWGEANVQKMTEHNVAVIVPTGKKIQDGLVIDPWRTSGKPFWVRVKNDKHYTWQQWIDFGEI